MSSYERAASTAAAYWVGERLVPGARGHDEAAVSSGDRVLAFGDIDRRASQVGAALQAAGLRPGDRVALFAHNRPEFVEILIGCARAGLVLMPLNWRLATDELVAIGRSSTPRALLAVAGSREVLDGLRGGRELDVDVELGDSYEAWIDAAPPLVTRARPAPGDVALQIYTSGTGGAPKGVMVTHQNLSEKVPRMVDLWRLGPTSVSLLATPLFHIGALSWSLISLRARASMVMAEDASPSTLWGHFSRSGVTHAFLVPEMMGALCAHVDTEAAGPRGALELEALVYGASPISEETQASSLRVFGPVLRQVYGMTETCGGFCELGPSDHGSRRSASVGRPYPWVEVEIREPATGVRVSVGEFGEVWTRSGQNCAGYFGDMDGTSELTTTDGWLRTGDGGHVDPDGFLFLTTRVKDMIISGGENVFPAEVENALRADARISDASVLGLPDRQWGETVVAVIVPGPNAVGITEEDVRSALSDRLARYKIPRRIVFRTSLPRNALGKVAKGELRAELLAAGSHE